MLPPDRDTMNESRRLAVVLHRVRQALAHAYLTDEDEALAARFLERVSHAVWMGRKHTESVWLACELHQKHGMNASEIADKLDVAESNVRRWLKRYVDTYDENAP